MKENKSLSLINLTDTICNMNNKDIPNVHFEKIKLSILDTLGVALLAKNTPDFNKIHDFYSSFSRGNSIVWGSNHNISSLDATFLNIYAGHQIDFDNILYGTFGHPSVILYPALFSIYDEGKVTGEELLKSILIGLETMTTFGMNFGRDLQLKKFHPTAVLGGLAISSSIGWLLKFSDEMLLNAFELIGTSFSGFQSSFGSLSKPYQVAVSGREALSATLLIQSGLNFKTKENCIDNLSILSGVTKNDLGNRKFGNPWILDEVNFLYKYYPCCGYFHHTMDGISKLLKSTNIDREAIETIHLILPEFIKNASLYDNPENIEEAKFSILFNIALVLNYDQLSFVRFSDIEVKKPEIINAMKKIKIKYINDEDAYYNEDFIAGKVQVEYKNKQSFETSIKLTDNGSVHDFDRIYEKFYQCTNSILNTQQIDRYVDFIMNIETRDPKEWRNLQKELFG